jgi:hypothetical protein
MTQRIPRFVLRDLCVPCGKIAVTYGCDGFFLVATLLSIRKVTPP